MKKIFVSLALLAVAFVLHISNAKAEAPVTTTVMVYMCGSNLESQYSMATRDIFEMMESEYDADFTDVVLMIGGSSQWELPSFEPEKSGIYQIRGNGFKRIWQGDTLNMGSSETLSHFLNQVYENYDSDRYVLIFWNHGGGPMNGVCWDENFDKDSLGMNELIEGLENSSFANRKLDLIGFDACLMGSVETAWMLSEYAHYMVASEETEPGSGWDYGFLNGIEKDASVEDTGSRIVNMYVDSFPEDHPTGITLSCIDLSAIDDVTDKMDAFFSEISGKMDMDLFKHMSTIRHYAQAYGRDLRVEESSDYDMVDMGSLVDTCMGYAPEAGDALKKALENAVVLSRSNLENSTGLSVYFPYYNEAAYERKGEDFRRSVFTCPGYTEYIDVFRKYMNADLDVDWRGLTPKVISNLSRDGKSFEISLFLSDKQKENLVSAKLVVLHALGTPEMVNCTFTKRYDSPNVMIEDWGRLAANYYDEAISVYNYVSDQYSVSSSQIMFRTLETGEYLVNAYVEDKLDGENSVKQDIQLVLSAPDENGSMKLKSIYVYDEITDSFSQRSNFTLDDFDYLYLKEHTLYMTRENGLIKPIELWERYKTDAEGTVRALDVVIPLDLRYPWEFKLERVPTARSYVAFEITDLQNNKFMTELEPIRDIRDEWRLRLSSVIHMIKGESSEFMYSCVADEPDMLLMSIEALNMEQGIYRYKIDDMKINGVECRTTGYFEGDYAIGINETSGMYYRIYVDDVENALKASGEDEVVISCRLWLNDVQKNEDSYIEISLEVAEDDLETLKIYWAKQLIGYTTH